MSFVFRQTQIVYADALSSFIHFYDLKSAKSGTWKGFFSHDISASLALVAVQDPNALAGINERLAALRDDDKQGEQEDEACHVASLSAAGALDAFKAFFRHLALR